MKKMLGVFKESWMRRSTREWVYLPTHKMVREISGCPNGGVAGGVVGAPRWWVGFSQFVGEI